MKILIRPHTVDDEAFIYATYLRNRYFDKANKTTLKRSTWTALHHNKLEQLFRYPDSIAVACLEDDPTVILGYGLVEDSKLYTYIKLAWRSPGLKIKERLEEYFK